MSANQKGTVDKTKAAEPKAKTKTPELDANETYTIIGTGTNKHLHEGVEYPADGAHAMLFIEAGHATLKADK